MAHLSKLALGLAGMLVVASGVWMLAFPNKKPVDPIPASELTAVVNEIMSIGEFYRSPEPNNGLTRLAYIRSMEGGSALCEVDLPQGGGQVLRSRPETRRLFGWSPDDRYLMFKDFGAKQIEWLQLYDSTDGSFRRATKETNPQVGQAAWLDAKLFAYIGKPSHSAELRLVSLDESHTMLGKISTPGPRDLIAQISRRKLAYPDKGQIWIIDTVSMEAAQLTTNTSKEFLWLNYSKENEEFLYCSDDDSDWRHLFRLRKTPGAFEKLTQLTFGPEHSYNGQWIQEGTGFAYVGNLTNHFYLAVRPKDSRLSTNLFFGGYIVGYRVSADGGKIYSAASIGAEPNGIWEYDIATTTLRCVVSGTNVPFTISRIIPAIEQWTKSFDGLSIPYYALEPRNLKPDRKHPLVISIPHEEGQFDQSWEKYAQYLANIGVFHMAVNTRGSDGYGKTFKENHPEDADKDILAVLKAALRNRNIDNKRVFLMAHSSGGQLVQKLATEHPDLWEGVILFGPGLSVPEHKPERLPRCFVFMGEKDSKGLVEKAREFEKWGRANGFQVKILYDQNTFHHITDVNVDRRIGAELAEFIFRKKFAADSQP
jgi:dienelactone hydrolase